MTQPVKDKDPTMRAAHRIRARFTSKNYTATPDPVEIARIIDEECSRCLARPPEAERDAGLAEVARFLGEQVDKLRALINGCAKGEQE
jgi:hypothetical protein